MVTFTVRLQRWRFVQPFGRHPLVRASDRVEALVLVLAVVVSLLAAPIAAAVGTAVYDSRRYSTPSKPRLGGRSPRPSSTTALPKSRRARRWRFLPDGLPLEPNTPARSSLDRQSKLVM